VVHTRCNTDWIGTNRPNPPIYTIALIWSNTLPTVLAGRCTDWSIAQGPVPSRVAVALARVGARTVEAPCCRVAGLAEVADPATSTGAVAHVRVDAGSVVLANRRTDRHVALWTFPLGVAVVAHAVTRGGAGTVVAPSQTNWLGTQSARVVGVVVAHAAVDARVQRDAVAVDAVGLAVRVVAVRNRAGVVELTLRSREIRVAVATVRAQTLAVTAADGGVRAVELEAVEEEAAVAVVARVARAVVDAVARPVPVAGHRVGGRDTVALWNIAAGSVPVFGAGLGVWSDTHFVRYSQYDVVAVEGVAFGCIVLPANVALTGVRCSTVAVVSARSGADRGVAAGAGSLPPRVTHTSVRGSAIPVVSAIG